MDAGKGRSEMDESEYTRSRATAYALIIGSLFALAFLVYAYWPSEPVTTLAGREVDLGPRFGIDTAALSLIWLASFVYGIHRWRIAGRKVVLTVEGIRDEGRRPRFVRWSEISDINWTTSKGRNELVITGPGREGGDAFLLSMDDINGGPGALYNDAMDRWNRSTGGVAKTG